MARDPEEEHPDESEEGGGPVKPFLEHLEDLRWVLIKCASALFVAMAGCMAAAPVIFDVLQRPLRATSGMRLEFIDPIGGVMSSMKIAFWGGLILSLPFILFFVGQFVVPALKPKEKKHFLRAFFIGGALFVGGVLLCYFFVLSLSLAGMVRFNQWLGVSTEFWRAEAYFQFVTMLMLGMGLSFEIPVLILTLVGLDVIPHQWLLKGRRYFFFFNFVLCAFITPDFLSTFFLVLPTQLLLEVCIWISGRWEKQKQAAANLAATQPSEVASPD